jgi:hypothetical protein
MSAWTRLAFSSLFLLLLLPVTAAAKGAPDKVTLQGTALPHALEITDARWLEHFAMDRLIDFDAAAVARADLESGYELTRYFLVGGGALKAIDTFIYYPPRAGGRGAVFYTGIIDKQFILGNSPHDGRWFQATNAGDQAMRDLLSAHGLPPVPAAGWPARLSNGLAWAILSGLTALAIAASVRRFRSKGLPIRQP